MGLLQRRFRGWSFAVAIGGTIFLGLMTLALPAWGVRTIIEATTVTEQRSESCDELAAEAAWLGWVRISDAVLDFHNAVVTRSRRNGSNRYGPDIYVPACRADPAHGGLPRVLVWVSDSHLAERLMLGDPTAMLIRPIEGTISAHGLSSDVETELRTRFGIRNSFQLTVIEEGGHPGTVLEGVGGILGGLLSGALLLLALRAWIARARGTAKTV